MTNYEYIKQKYPSRINDFLAGGVIGCPNDYGLKNSLRQDNEYCKQDCNKCWQLQIKK